MEKETELFRRLKGWLDKPGNNPLIIASELGYKTSFTVTQWVRRGKIPKHQRQNVKRIITHERRK